MKTLKPLKVTYCGLSACGFRPQKNNLKRSYSQFGKIAMTNLHPITVLFTSLFDLPTFVPRKQDTNINIYIYCHDVTHNILFIYRLALISQVLTLRWLMCIFSLLLDLVSVWDWTSTVFPPWSRIMRDWALVLVLKLHGRPTGRNLQDLSNH